MAQLFERTSKVPDRVAHSMALLINGIVGRWFAWIEWSFLTAALLVGHVKVQGNMRWLLLALGVVSMVALAIDIGFVALATLNKQMNILISRYPRAATRVICAAVGAVTSFSLVLALRAIILAIV